MVKRKKEVKKQVRQVKNNFELDIINLIKKGLNPSKIAIHLNISLPNLQYYLSSLKEQGVIKKVGYATWEIIPYGEVKILSHKGSSQVKDVRGHAFIWKIKPTKNLDWEMILKEKNMDFTRKGIAGTPRCIIDGKKIWFGRKHITIFEPEWNSFFAENPIESKKEAIFGMLNTINKIKDFAGDFKYKFTCRRQHYGFINSKDAMYFNKKGKKILIKNEKGYWFSIDYSQNKYKEAETIHERDADVDGMGYQRLMNSHEKTDFKVTPEFTLEAINKLTSVQLIEQKNKAEYSRDLVAHKEAIKTMGNNTEANTRSVELLAETILKMKESFELSIKKLNEEIKKAKK